MKWKPDQNLLECIPSPWVVSQEDGKLLYLNPKAWELIGAIGQEETELNLALWVDLPLLVNLASHQSTGRVPSAFPGSQGEPAHWFVCPQEPEKTYLLYFPQGEIWEDHRDQLLRTVSHDFKNSINGLQGMLQIIQNPGPVTMDKSQALDYARSALFRMEEMVENLHLWSRATSHGDRIQEEAVFLDERILELLEYFEHALKKKEIKLNSRLDKDLVSYTNSFLFSSVLKNLLSNAIRFSPPKGEILFTVEKKEEGIAFQLINIGDPLDQKELDSFFQHKANLSKRNGTRGEKGLGLGLIIVRDFLEKLGLKLEYEGKNGLNHFSFILPPMPKEP